MAIPIPTRNNNDDVITSWWNELVQEINNLAQGVTAILHLTLDGKATASAPAVSPSGDARIYYDTDDDELKISRNAGAYEAMLSGVIQVAIGSDATGFDTTSGTYGDTGLSVSFTPKRADSTIYVFAQHHLTHSGASTQSSIRIMRDAVELVELVNNGQLASSNSGTLDVGISGWTSEASPGTSAVTYHTEARRDSGSATVKLNENGIVPATMLVVEVR